MIVIAIGFFCINSQRNPFKVVVPIGAAISLASVVILLSNLDDLSTIGPHLAVCILSMLYAYIAKIVVIALISRKE